MKTSHLSVTGSYLIMSPGPAAPTTKLEKKNAVWLATQVGRSFQLYLTEKPGQMSLRVPARGASKAPGGHTGDAAGDTSGAELTSAPASAGGVVGAVPLPGAG